MSSPATPAPADDKLVSFKCPFCPLGKCYGAATASGPLVTHTVPTCVVFDQLDELEFLRAVGRMHALACRRRMARA